MKRLLYTFCAALILVSCIGNGSKSTNKEQGAETKATTQETIYSLDELLHSAQELVETEVIVRGTVTHTCKHSGRRCFIVGDDQKTSFRVEATGDIGGFNRELIGSELAIKGMLRENRLTHEYLNAWEERVKEQEGKEDGSAESCHSETNNINEMRAWMAKNNKEYYSLYFMDGTSFEVVE